MLITIIANKYFADNDDNISENRNLPTIHLGQGLRINILGFSKFKCRDFFGILHITNIFFHSDTSTQDTLLIITMKYSILHTTQRYPSKPNRNH